MERTWWTFVGWKQLVPTHSLHYDLQLPDEGWENRVTDKSSREHHEIEVKCGNWPTEKKVSSGH